MPHLQRSNRQENHRKHWLPWVQNGGGGALRRRVNPRASVLEHCLFQSTVFVPRAHWEAYGRGTLSLHNLYAPMLEQHGLHQVTYCDEWQT